MSNPLVRFSLRSVSALAFFGLTTAADVLLFFDRELPVSIATAFAPPRGLAPLLFLTSLAMLLVNSRRTFLYMLCPHFGLAAIVLWTGGRDIGISLLASILALMPALVYERYPVNLALALGWVGATTLIIHPILGAGLGKAGLYGLSGILLAATGSLLGRFREAMVDLQRYTRRLEDNVTSLTKAVSMSQDYVRDAEEKSRLAERSRLTGDIHDTVGYTLTNNIMMMEAVKLLVDTEPQRIGEYVEMIRRNTEEGLAEIRKILRDLRRYDEREETLFFAMKRLVKVFSSSTGVNVRFEFGNVVWPVLEAYRDVVYHFIQEGLINAFRHGKADHVTLSFWDDGEQTRMTLEDDGQGPLDGAEEGIGITGMRERLAVARGRVEIEPAMRGFRISGYLPSRIEAAP